MSRLLVAQRALTVPGWVKDDLSRKARAIPSLDLRFADNKSLVDAVTGAQLVTFTRASSGTFVGSDGVLRTAVTNLLLRSEEFDVTWGKPAGVTVTANTTEAPNGTQTADTLSGAINIDHNGTNLSQSITATESKSYIFSIYVKSLTATTFSIRLRDNTAASVITAITPTSSWQRVSCTLTTGIGATTLVARVGGANGDVAIWGAQLEQASTDGEYIPTTSVINSAPRFDHNPTTGESLGLLVEEQRTNLILQSEDFSTTWTNVNTSEAINVATAPDGTTTADKLITNNGVAGVSSYITQTVAKSAAATTYTYSAFAKTGDTGTGTFQLLAADTATTANSATSSFSTVSGTVTVAASVNGTFTNASSIITPLANGWYRCSLTFTTGTETSINLRLYSRLPTTGNGSSGLLLWGAQLEAGAFATSYIPTTTATVTRAADVASITGSNFGTTRTNLLVRSEEFDNASWTKTRSSITANAITAPDGTLTGDKLIDSTDASASHFISQSISFVSGTTYTVSIFAKQDEIRYLRLGFNTTPFGTTQIVFFDLLNGVISSNPNALAASITNAGNGWWRLAVTATATATASDLILISLSSNGTSISFTGTGTNGLYLWGAQLETSSAVTPYIPTTSAAVSVFESSWYRQDEGTIFVEGATSASTASPILFQADDGTANERIQVRRNGTTNASSLLVTDGGTTQANFGVTGYNANTIGKTCAMYSLNDFQLSFNGTLGTADTTGTLPTVDRAFIGSASSPVYANGPIKRLTYWPQALPSRLQALTQ